MTIPTPIQAGDRIGGYRVERVESIAELDVTLVALVHPASGARHLHVANADAENAFSVAFKTVPADSTGVAHILEHTVLCGSRRYPVRDPFFSMLKRSLSTFMNAFTASDWTMYPFSTQNRKDFYNLMDVYLDAAFFPVIDPLSFKQEGHRLEFEKGADGTERLVYKGVVFNEMKGAMSSPDQVMGRGLLNALYPDTTYRNNSGGDPAAIPGLTHADLVAFHQHHYHPSNAFFYTYGNLPLADHLAFIEERVLSHFTAIDPGTEVPNQPRWSAPREAVYAYPLAPGEDPARKYQACVAWLAADIRDSFEVLVLEILEQILLGNDSAPLRRALMDSGLGTALSDGSGFDGDNRDTLFACGLKEVAADAAPAVERIVFETLAALVRDGVPEDLVESAVHQIEFHRKEVTNTPYPYGLKLLLHLAGGWLHGADPALMLRFDEDLARLRAEMAKGGFFEARIGRYFLDNPHRVRFVLAPDTEMAARDAARETAELEARRAALTQTETEAIRADAEALARRQEMDEDVSCLPTLALSEIAPRVPVSAPADRYGSAPALCYPQPTAGIVYLSAVAGIGRIAPAQRALIPFYCYAASRIGTKRRDYAAMARRIDTYTGGLGLAVQARTRFDGERDCLPFVSLAGKSLVRNHETMFEILAELLAEADFADPAHIQRLLLEYKAHHDAMVVHNGHRLAMSLAARRFSPTAALNETWGGVHQLKALKALSRSLDNGGREGLVSDLAALGSALFGSGNLQMALVAEEGAMDRAREALGAFSRALPEAVPAFEAELPEVPAGPVYEGWSTATAVSFVAQCFPTVRLGHADAPALAVIAKMLRSLYLHREIREKGGAYGGFAVYSIEDGLFSLASYRDPQIARTLKVFQGTADFLLSGKYTDEDVHEAVLQVCSEIDKPDPPGPAARKAFFRRVIGLDDEARLGFKQGLLALGRARVRQAVEAHFGAAMRESAVAVISSEDLLAAANAELKDAPLKVQAIG